MEINEPFVVYLFSKFHERLGFEKVLYICAGFPDCIAEKDGEQVSIEFETHTSFLQNHLKIKEYDPSYELMEEEEEYVLQPKELKGFPRVEDYQERYPKSEFRIKRKRWPAGEFITVYAKKLNLDYCVCWRASYKIPDSLKDVKIIELRKEPAILQFLNDRGYDTGWKL